MKQSYLKYYKNASAFAPVHFMIDAIFAKTPNRRLALQNRSKDYKNLVQNETLMALHYNIHLRILNAVQTGSFYDYGEGYFYQSLDRIGITGFRDTKARIDAMELIKLVKGKSVLEIGCNAGFLSIGIASFCSKVLAFDIMEYLVEIGREVATHEGINNIEFKTASFEELSDDAKYEVVLSFANHSTYDGQTSATINEYFKKCYDMCADGGTLLFESHPPQHEGDGLKQVISVIEKYFIIENRTVLEYGGFLDTGRTFVIARRSIRSS